MKPPPHYSFDLLRWAGLRRRERTPEDRRYPTFNRRMLAAAADSVAVLPFMSVMEEVCAQFYGQAPLSWDGLVRIASSQPGREEASAAIREALVSTGYVEWWMSNMMTQFGMMGALILLCWSFWAATPGKMLFRMRIVDVRTEAPITFLQGILRLFGYVLSFPFLLGFFWIGCNRKKRAWHDYFAGTVVLAVSPRRLSATSGSPIAGPSGSQAPEAAE